jgi:ribosomal protein S18 acetylase RimI-like enzyme
MEEKMATEIFRTLTGADEEILWQMLRYAAHEDSIEGLRQQPILARYAAAWGRAGDIGWVAERENLVLGAAWLRLPLPADLGFGYVDLTIPELAIAVVPDRQGQGIGTELLTRVLNSARPLFPAVSLSVRSNNPAVRLYERAGFVPVENSDVANRVGGTSFTMLCRFDPNSI